MVRLARSGKLRFGKLSNGKLSNGKAGMVSREKTRCVAER